MKKIWKQVNGQLVGFGKEYFAHVYVTEGFPEFEVPPVWTVLVMCNGVQVAKFIDKSERTVKRWAEKNYLREY